MCTECHDGRGLTWPRGWLDATSGHAVFIVAVVSLVVRGADLQLVVNLPGLADALVRGTATVKNGAIVRVITEIVVPHAASIGVRRTIHP